MIEFCHSVLAGHFFPLLTHFYLRTLKENVPLCKSNKKKTLCSHDNSLMSRFPPPNEPPVHLRNMFPKKNLRSFLKKDVLFICIFLLLRGRDGQVLFRICHTAAVTRPRAPHVCVLNETDPFCKHRTSCSEPVRGLQKSHPRTWREGILIKTSTCNLSDLVFRDQDH